jgi:hypothetical protein
MSKQTQKTGRDAKGGPGLGAGVSGVKAHKVSVPGNFKTSPNSANRGKGQK